MKMTLRNFNAVSAYETKTMKYIRMALFVLWLMAVGCTVTLALLPADYVPTQSGSDKMLHMLTFCLLMILPATTFDSAAHIIISAFFLACVGIGIEILQGFVPTRNPELMDIIYDGGGLVIGLLIGLLFRDAYRSLSPSKNTQGYF